MNPVLNAVGLERPAASERMQPPGALGTVAIVGMGYVGLPTALSYMDAGFQVVGIDVSACRLADIQDRRVDLSGTDMGRLSRHLDEGNLTLDSGDSAALWSLVSGVIVCVPTPVDTHLVPDLGPLASACEFVVARAIPGQTIVLTSTTYVGCTKDLVVEPLIARGFTPGEDIYVVYSPERIDPGVESHRPELTARVIGGWTPECTRHGIELLRPTCQDLHPTTSTGAAEMAKLLENTFRAVNIALVNEFADASLELGIDVNEVIDAASTKPYGFMRFTPGPGVGGHCIPCDPHYLLWQLKRERKEAPVIDAAMKSIAARLSRVTSRITETLAELGCALSTARVHVIGVAFKPGVADLRESPALEVLEWLVPKVGRVTYSDEYVPTVSLNGATLHSVPNAPEDTDLVVVLTVHPTSDLSWVASGKPILDGSFKLPSADVRRL